MRRRGPKSAYLPLRLERRHRVRVPREPAKLLDASLRQGLTLDELLASCSVFLDELGHWTGVRPVAPVVRNLHGSLVDFLLGGQPQKVFATTGVYVLTASAGRETVLYVGRCTNTVSAIAGRLLEHFLPSGGRPTLGVRLREAFRQVKTGDGGDLLAQHRSLRRAVFGANGWLRRFTSRARPARRPELMAAAELVGEGAFELTLIPLQEDGCEYAPAMEWRALEAARRRYRRLPPLNEVHAMLSSNGYRSDRVRWGDSAWRERLEHCAARALAQLVPLKDDEAI